MRSVLSMQWLKRKFSNTVNEENMTKPTIIDNGLIIKQTRKPHTYSMPFGMAFVSGNNTQVAAFTSCRDYMHDQVRTFLHGKKRLGDDHHPYYPEQGDPDLVVDRMRVLLYFDTNFQKDKLEHALSVLNTLELFGGMELTIAEMVTVKGAKKGTTVLLRGSGEYMTNPHLLSLVTLTMRFCYYNNKFKVDGHRALTNNYKKINPNKDAHLMVSCHKILHHVLKNREDLFKDVNYKKLFPTSIGYNFHSKGGIQHLCTSQTNNAVVNENIKKLKKRFSIK